MRALCKGWSNKQTNGIAYTRDDQSEHVTARASEVPNEQGGNGKEVDDTSDDCHRYVGNIPQGYRYVN